MLIIGILITYTDSVVCNYMCPQPHQMDQLFTGPIQSKAAHPPSYLDDWTAVTTGHCWSVGVGGQ